MSAHAPKMLGEGPDVLIRHPSESDHDEWCRLWDESWAFLAPWFPKPASEHEGEAGTRFRRTMEAVDSATDQRHLICRKADGAIVGMVNLGQIFRGPFCSCYMGYWVGKAFVRQGFASQGIRLVLARAFGDLELHRVEANIVPTNTASIALAKRIGFREEGYSPGYLKIAGVWQDHVRYALTAEDWQSMSADQPK